MTAPVLLTIGGVAYPFNEETLRITRKTSEARRCQVTLVTAFARLCEKI